MKEEAEEKVFDVIFFNYSSSCCDRAGSASAELAIASPSIDAAFQVRVACQVRHCSKMNSCLLLVEKLELIILSSQ